MIGGIITTKEKISGIYFKVSDKERRLIRRRMAQTHIRNMSAYIRKMCIDGYVINLDVKTLKELMMLMRVSASNINQIAHKLNETWNFHTEDMEKLKQHYDKLWAAVGNVLTELSVTQK